MALTNEQFAQLKSQLQAQKQSTPTKGLPNDQFQALKEKLKQQKTYNTAASSGIVPGIPKTVLPGVTYKPLKDTFVAQAFTGNTQKLGKTAGEAFNANYGVELYTKALNDYNNNLLKYKDNPKALQYVKKPELSAFVGTDTARRMNETFGQNLKEVGGQALGTVVEATAGGLPKLYKPLSVASNSFKLVKPAVQTADEVAKAKAAYQALSFGQKAKTIGVEGVKDFARTSPFGYAYDVSSGLQGERGEDRTGGKAFIPGAGSLFSAGLPAAIGSFKVGGALGSAIIPQTARENIARVLKNTGTKNLSQVGTNKELDKAVGGFNTIRENAPNIKVKDINDVEKVFNPKEADFFELPQALKQTKDAVYKEYSDIAAKAGDAGVTFNKNDFDALDSVLTKYEGKGYTPAFSTKAKQFKEALARFEEGTATPSEIQDLIEKVNLDVNPLSDKAGTQVANDFSVALRKALDDKLEQSGNPAYQATRDKYAQLKSIEKDVIARYKEALRKANANPNIIDGVATLDAIMGVINMEPTQIIRGGVIEALKKGFTYLRNPEVNLRRAFDVLEKEGQKVKSLPVNQATQSTIKMTPKIPISPTLPQNKGIVNQAVDKLKSIPNQKGGFISTGYKGEKDLTTKILKDLEGKTTVSKQYILDATNRGELKQVERDLFREILETEKGDTINVSDFAKKVKAELLPLKVKDTVISQKEAVAKLKKAGYEIDRDMSGDANILNRNGDLVEYDELPRETQRIIDGALGNAQSYGDIGKPKYENIALPDELRGKVKNYKENIYESPIKTSAGQTHFNGQSENYFGHTRIEDMADNKTRRVIEVQSDLYQKGNLEREMQLEGYDFSRPKYEAVMTPQDLKEYKFAYNTNSAFSVGVGTKESLAKARKTIDNLEEKYKPILEKAKQDPLKKLQQYNDPTAHFRMVREEIKKASQDGKTKLQFPTGETAMKIEGLGQTDGGTWRISPESGNRLHAERLTSDKLKVGMSAYNANDAGGDWIITDVLGDGKFKAVPKDKLETIIEDAGIASDSIDVNDWVSYAENHRNIDLSLSTEQFDISGKVDTNNPIYKFYEKDVQKYLNKFGGKRVVDDKGVSWIEVPITKEQGKAPVEAFGKVKINPLLIGAGASLAGVAIAAQVEKKKKGLPKYKK